MVTPNPQPKPPQPRFFLGQILITPMALRVLEQAEMNPVELLARHQHGNWGLLDTADWLLNEEAVRDGDRIHSVYRLHTGIRLWVITQPNRSSTTIVLPEEYGPAPAPDAE